MGDFVHGWKRKIGCVTLMMALVFTLGWIRSFAIRDVVALPRTDTEEVFSSSYQSLSWLSYRFSSPESPVFLVRHDGTDTAKWFTPQIRLGSRLIWDDAEIRWRWRWCGFGEGEVQAIATDGNKNTFRVIPYWFLTIPLTLTSAFLLLTKPRKSTPTTIPEPIPAEGA